MGLKLKSLLHIPLCIFGLQPCHARVIFFTGGFVLRRINYNVIILLIVFLITIMKGFRAKRNKSITCVFKKITSVFHPQSVSGNLYVTLEYESLNQDDFPLSFANVSSCLCRKCRVAERLRVYSVSPCF